MMGLVPRHLKSIVKSGLRDVRYVARKLGDAARTNGDTGTRRIIGKVATYSDATLTAVESIALDILSDARRSTDRPTVPQPLSCYTNCGPYMARARLERDAYAGIRQIMRIKGVTLYRVRESSLGAGAAGLRSRLAGGKALTEMEICHAAAVLAQGLAQSIELSEPDRFYDDRRRCFQDAGSFVAAALALSSGVASYRGDLREEDEAYTSVCAAIDSRYGAIASELAPGSSPDALSRHFLGLIRHLP